MSSKREREIVWAEEGEYRDDLHYLDPTTWQPLEPHYPPGIPCTMSDPNTTIRVAPMERECGGWNERHFSSRLGIPANASSGKKGIVVLLQALARECVAVALSPQPEFVMGKTYVVHFGAAGNLQTVLRRRLPNGTEAMDVTFPSRVCSPDRFVSYWVVLNERGHLSAGVGDIPGKKVIGVFDDSLYHQLRSGVDAVKYVGIGNSALGWKAKDLRVRRIRVTGLPDPDGIVVEEPSVVRLDDEDVAAAGELSEEVLFKEYEEQCRKQKARAEKFGIPYKEPPPSAFSTWSNARRLRANPQKGFITGIDMESEEEKRKREARKARFSKRKVREEGDENEEGGEPNNEDEEQEEEEEGDYLMENNTAKVALPVEQAWDNEELVRDLRIDPPTEGAVTVDMDENDEEREQKMENTDRTVFPVPEKVHLFGIDWAAFKQIRTDDVMAYFSDYGPSYVEWLGELSCNVLFEDQFSASRALMNLTQELPSPPPESVQKNCPQEQKKTDNNGTNEKEVAPMDKNVDDNETKADSTNPAPMDENVDTAAADSGDVPEKNSEIIDETDNKAAPTTKPATTDLGSMGWRFCKHPVRKVANDRFGRRGTRARVLMRTANSHDILEERPREWPAPPPGFTTKRVLGPGSDFNTGRRRRRQGKRQRVVEGGNEEPVVEQHQGGEHPGLSRGLRASRGGFTVEQIQAERAVETSTSNIN